MVFQKGNQIWKMRKKTGRPKGIPMSNEQKKQSRDRNNVKILAGTFKTPFVKGGVSPRKGVILSIETRNKMSVSRIGKKYPNLSKAMKGKFVGENNPMYRHTYTKETIEKQSLAKKRLYSEHPEKHPNLKMQNVSKGQRFMYEQLKKFFYPNLVLLEYPVKTKHSVRYIDVALPQFNLGFEYDGAYWHQNQDENNARDLELKEKGWEIIHIEVK